MVLCVCMGLIEAAIALGVTGATSISVVLGRMARWF